MEPTLTLWIVIAIYCIHVLWYSLGLVKANRARVDEETAPFTSVLVPFRNEVTNLPSLVDGLAHQSLGPNAYKVVLIDDGSTDGSYEEALRLTKNIDHFMVLRSNGQGKKSAISTGEKIVSKGIIVTTDADTKHGKNWLKKMASSWSSETYLAIHPVVMDSSNFWGQLIALESLSLAGVAVGSAAMGSPVLCSGANLGYRAEWRDSVELKGENYMSGDDMFLLEVFRKGQGKVKTALTREDVVQTSPPSTWSEFLDQRVRWAHKSKGFRDVTILWHAFIVWFTNLILFISLLVGIFDQPLLDWAIGALAIKAVIDFLFLFLIASRVGRMAYLWYFPIVEVLYLPYAALIPVMTLFRKVNWRERLVR